MLIMWFFFGLYLAVSAVALIWLAEEQGKITVMDILVAGAALFLFPIFMLRYLDRLVLWRKK